jgi:autotransporter translocation and assembly factor TamB
MTSPRSWLKSVLRAHGIAASFAVRAVGVLVGFLSLAAAVALFLATQTDFGRNAALSYAETALNGAFNGSVKLGPVIGGNLLTRSTLERVEIRGPDGELFVELENVRLSYSPFGILSGRYIFRRLSTDRLKLILRQYPEGGWNFDRIFGGEPDSIPDSPLLPEPPSPVPFPPPLPELEPEGVRVSIVDGQVREGEVAIIWPFGHDLSETEYEAAVRSIGRGEAVWHFEPDGDGYARVIRVLGMAGRFPLVRIAEPGEPVRIDLEEMSAQVRAVRQPLDFRRFDGSMVFEDSIRFDITQAELGASRLEGAGWITSGDNTVSGEGTDFRFDLDGDPIGFADLQWLPIPIPSEGGGPGDVVVRSESGRAFVEFREAVVSVRDSRMDGGMVIELGAVPRFDSLSVRLRPLRLSLVDEILERETLIDGYLSGPLEGTGPVDAIDLTGDLEATDLPDPDRETEIAPSYLRLAGEVGIVAPRRLGNLSLDLTEFEPRWAAAVGLESRLGGRLAGPVIVDGVPGDSVRVSAEVEHRTPAGDISRIGGDLELYKAASAVELDATLGPLQLRAFEIYLQQVRRAQQALEEALGPEISGRLRRNERGEITLIGSVRGTILLSGRLDALEASADLLTPRGNLAFNGKFDLAAERKTYDAELEASGIQLNEWIEDGPDTDLAVTGRVSGVGTDPADAEATFDLAILPSMVEGARIDSSLLRFTLAGGLAQVDTFAIRGELGVVDGLGTFGLEPEAAGRLKLTVRSDLSRWNRWPASDLTAEEGDGPGREGQDLLAGFADQEGTGEGARADTLAGFLVADGALLGNVDRIGLETVVSVDDVAYGSFAADSLRGIVQVSDLGGRDTLSLEASAFGLYGGPVGDEPLVIVQLDLDRQGGAWIRFTGHAERDSTTEVTIAGDLQRDSADVTIRAQRIDVRVGERSYSLDAPARLERGEAGLFVDALALSDGAGSTIRMRGAIPSAGEADFDLEVESVLLAEVFELAFGETRFDGTASGNLRVRGTADLPLIESRLTIERPQLDSTSFLLLTSDLSYTDRQIEGEVELSGPGMASVKARGQVAADLSFRSVERRVPEDAVDIDLEVRELPFEIVRLINSDLIGVEGELDGNVRVRGRPGSFSYGGRIDLTDGSAWVIPLQVRYTDMQGRAAFEGQEAHIESFRLRSELGGEGEATGTIGLAAISNPAFDLDLTMDRFQAIDTREMAFAVTGAGKLGGEYRAPDLTGRVRLSEGNILMGEVFRGPEVVNLTDPEIASLIDTTIVEERRLLEREKRSFLYNLRADLDVEVGPGAWLRSPEMDVELGGEIDVLLHPAEQDMRVTGTLNLVRGSYRFRLQGLPSSREFKIDRGKVEFIGAPTPNPRLEVFATHQTRTDRGKLDIEAHLTGTLSDMDVSLTSEPPLSESDQICYLTLGAPCGAFATEQQGAATALGLGQQATLGLFGSQLQPVFVGDLGLDLFQVRSAGSDQLRASDASFFSGAEVEVGSYIGPDVFFTYTQPLDGRRPDVSVEWFFSEGWTLEARYDNRYQRLFSAGSNLETQQNLGIFLFREWSY